MAVALSLAASVAQSTAARASSAISLAGIDYQQLCRDTQHVPLVQAAIRPGFINIWTERESRRAGRYEQYSFKTQRIDVRVEHDVSLYHGLIHRTLDLIGESQWKHRDYGSHEDQEHWLIYYTLETHWPGLQRAQGNEPTLSMLAVATDYWRQHGDRYAEIVAKASALAEKSWCATNRKLLEADATPAKSVPPALALTQPPAKEIVLEKPAEPARDAAKPQPVRMPVPSLPSLEETPRRPAVARTSTTPVLETARVESPPVPAATSASAAIVLSTDPTSHAPVVRSTWSDRQLLPANAPPAPNETPFDGVN